MNTVELIQSVRDYTDANPRDYSDAKIQRAIDREYRALQEILVREGNVEWEAGVIDLTYTAGNDYQTTDPNLHIQRVEASRDGEKWVTLQRTTYNDYLGAKNSCWCGKGSLTDALKHESCPQRYIQTNDGLHVFPIPTDGLEVKVYIRGHEEIDWNDNNFEPSIAHFAQECMTYKAALLYRDLHDTNTIEWLQNEYLTNYNLFLKHAREGGKVIKMNTKDKKYA